MPQSPIPARSPAPILATGQASRRQQPRNSLRVPVSIAIAGGPERSGTTVDLSRDGLSLTTDRPITPGSRCTLRLASDGVVDSLRVEVKSVYSSYAAPGDFRIGMVFTDPAHEAHAQLRALLGHG